MHCALCSCSLCTVQLCSCAGDEVCFLRFFRDHLHPLKILWGELELLLSSQLNIKKLYWYWLQVSLEVDVQCNVSTVASVCHLRCPPGVVQPPWCPPGCRKQQFNTSAPQPVSNNNSPIHWVLQKSRWDSCRPGGYSPRSIISSTQAIYYLTICYQSVVFPPLRNCV